jgi:cytochrome P450
LRKLVAQGFLRKYIQSLAPAIERLVDELLDAIAPDAHRIEIMRAVAKPLPAIVIAEMMGFLEVNDICSNAGPTRCWVPPIFSIPH